MSKPKNHHYVSQCHQKEFLDDIKGRIYLYDKESDNYYSKLSTRHLFSEDHLNSKPTKYRIDQNSLEDELKVLFEDNFPKHVNQIKKLLLSPENAQIAYESLCWITLLGILGELRHPYFKRNLDEAALNIELEIMTRFFDIRLENASDYLKNRKVTPHNNALSYLETAFRNFEKLEPLDFLIVTIESNDLFILPDTSSYQLRGQLRKYLDPYINEIIQVGIPITKKIFILATSHRCKTELQGIWYEKKNNSDFIFQINKDLLSFSKKAIACSNQEYLKRFIDKVKRDK